MRAINEIIIHCSFTKASMDIGVKEIRQWHTDPKPKGNGWSDIGYHYVIARDGEIQTGRPVETPGAHARNHNAKSIGVCLVGGMDKEGKPRFNYTQPQMDALKAHINHLKRKYPKAKIIGHNDVSNKDCPCFNVGAYFE